DVYDSEEDIEQIDTIIKKYGGEMQGLGYTPMGFKILADVYFENKLSELEHNQLEVELSQLTGVKFEVDQSSRLIL
ncbi:hypothetical protein, partial [Psychrobacter sp.]|uniref:hypothetical protein n=1 Tax=Psychrobacter sp. TaxID=56811 RepID=UPI0025D52BD4